jgi:glycerol-3-phosphate acyltransferase PlsY
VALPIFLLTIACAAAGVVAVGMHPMWGGYGWGLALICGVRQFQWPLLAVSLLASVGLMGLVLGQRRSGRWMLGLVPVLLVAMFFDTQMPFENRTPFEDSTVVRLIAGIVAVVGHMFSVFAGFRGGKGINTSVGMLIAVAPVELAIAAGVFLLFIGLFGYVSLGSMVAAIVIPITMFIRRNVLNVNIDGYLTLVYFMAALALLVLYAHRTNLRRLLEGTEHRFPKLMFFRRKHRHV